MVGFVQISLIDLVTKNLHRIFFVTFHRPN